MKSNKKGEDMKNILLAIVFIGSLVSLNALQAQVRFAEFPKKEGKRVITCSTDKDCPEGSHCPGESEVRICRPQFIGHSR